LSNRFLSDLLTIGRPAGNRSGQYSPREDIK